MGLSYRDAERLGPHVAALHPDAPGAARPAAEPAAPAPKARVPKVDDLGRNKTEARFATRLEDLKAAGRVAAYGFEPFNLHLGPRTWLKVDFAVALPGSPRLVLIDVKGGYRGDVKDDSAVKLKWAARDFAWLGDLWVVRPGPKSSWLFYRVHPRSGIAGVPETGDSWMKGSE